jgi:hypothetical protein
MERSGRIYVIRFEPHVVSRLPQLQKDFPKMSTGICCTSSGARAFLEAGMKCIVVGGASIAGPDVTECRTWTDLKTIP